MAIGETIPTIAELKGNTILELFKNGYNAIKNALFRKQNKLVAGDNIVIDEDSNRISAIVGGEPVLDDYYTKVEVNEIASELSADINDKADADDVYTKSEVYNKTETYNKTEVDNIISSLSGEVEVIDVALTQNTTRDISFTEELKDGDVIVCNIRRSNNTEVCSFVTSATNVQNVDKASHLKFNMTRNSADTGAFYLDSFYIYWDTSANKYLIKDEGVTVNINNSVVTIGDYERDTMSATNSKVTIYRRKTE